MGSIRKPKRLKIRGNDEKDYMFLIKGGEDLRLDQRVQQLFSVMNEIFARDSACSKRRLGIKTFQVVPMTTKVGAIEWIENTQPLREIIEEEISKKFGHDKKDSSILKIPAAKVSIEGFTHHYLQSSTIISLDHRLTSFGSSLSRAATN